MTPSLKMNKSKQYHYHFYSISSLNTNLSKLEHYFHKSNNPFPNPRRCFPPKLQKEIFQQLRHQRLLQEPFISRTQTSSQTTHAPRQFRPTKGKPERVRLHRNQYAAAVHLRARTAETTPLQRTLQNQDSEPAQKKETESPLQSQRNVISLMNGFR